MSFKSNFVYKLPLLILILIFGVSETLAQTTVISDNLCKDQQRGRKLEEVSIVKDMRQVEVEITFYMMSLNKLPTDM